MTVAAILGDDGILVVPVRPEVRVLERKLGCERQFRVMGVISAYGERTSAKGRLPPFGCGVASVGF